MSDSIRVRFANTEEAQKFVNWVIERDDIPYVAMPDGFTAWVILFPISKVMVDE